MILRLSVLLFFSTSNLSVCYLSLPTQDSQKQTLYPELSTFSGTPQDLKGLIERQLSEGNNSLSASQFLQSAANVAMTMSLQAKSESFKQEWLTYSLELTSASKKYAEKAIGEASLLLSNAKLNLSQRAIDQVSEYQAGKNLKEVMQTRYSIFSTVPELANDQATMNAAGRLESEALMALFSTKRLAEERREVFVDAMTYQQLRKDYPSIAAQVAVFAPITAMRLKDATELLRTVSRDQAHVSDEEKASLRSAMEILGEWQKRVEEESRRRIDQEIPVPPPIELFK